MPCRTSFEASDGGGAPDHEHAWLWSGLGHEEAGECVSCLASIDPEGSVERPEEALLTGSLTAPNRLQGQSLTGGYPKGVVAPGLVDDCPQGER